MAQIIQKEVIICQISYIFYFKNFMRGRKEAEILKLKTKTKCEILKENHPQRRCI